MLWTCCPSKTECCGFSCAWKENETKWKEADCRNGNESIAKCKEKLSLAQNGIWTNRNQSHMNCQGHNDRTSNGKMLLEKTGCAVALSKSKSKARTWKGEGRNAWQVACFSISHSGVWVCGWVGVWVCGWVGGTTTARTTTTKCFQVK